MILHLFKTTLTQNENFETTVLLTTLPQLEQKQKETSL